MISKATIKLAHRVTKLSKVWQWYLIPWFFHYRFRSEFIQSEFVHPNLFSSSKTFHINLPIIALLPLIVLFHRGHCNHLPFPNESALQFYKQTVYARRTVLWTPHKEGGQKIARRGHERQIGREIVKSPSRGHFSTEKNLPSPDIWICKKRGIWMLYISFQ